jgi:hypothetical protein
MRTAAHSCLMTRKSLGGARTTAATRELLMGASASDGASDGAALLPRCEDELRHSRLHFRPFPAPAPPGRPTSARIHLPDAPIDTRSRNAETKNSPPLSRSLARCSHDEAKTAKWTSRSRSRGTWGT